MSVHNYEVIRARARHWSAQSGKIICLLGCDRQRAELSALVHQQLMLALMSTIIGRSIGLSITAEAFAAEGKTREGLNLPRRTAIFN